MSTQKPTLAGLMSAKGQAAPTPAAAPAPAPVEGPPKALTVKLPPRKYRRLRLLAAETDRSHQDIMEAAFDAYMETLGR